MFKFQYCTYGSNLQYTYTYNYSNHYYNKVLLTVSTKLALHKLQIMKQFWKFKKKTYEAIFFPKD